jgi:hypothetical protein
MSEVALLVGRTWARRVSIALGNADHQAQIVFDHGLTGGKIARPGEGGHAQTSSAVNKGLRRTSRRT